MSESKEPRIEIRYVDANDCDGHIHTSLNGFSKPDLCIDFSTGNNVKFVSQLQALLWAVYSQGVYDGEASGKDRVLKLLEWANEI